MKKCCITVIEYNSVTLDEVMRGEQIKRSVPLIIIT